MFDCRVEERPVVESVKCLGIRRFEAEQVGAHYREGRRARSTAEFISTEETAL